MYPDTIFKATNRHGESCHFGSESAAANFAGKHGAITPITIHPEPETLAPPLSLVINPTRAYAAKEDGPYFECEDDVIESLKDEYGEGATAHIWKGIKRELHHSDFIAFDADEIIERMQEAVFEECGEWADDYLPAMPPDNVKSLESHLKAAAIEWFNANVPQPQFWLVDQVEAIEITL